MATIPTWMTQEIKKKAESGIALDTPTPEKQQLYDQYQTRIKDLVQQKAYSGLQLDKPNQYKTGLYQEYQQQPATDMFNKQQEYLNNMFNQQREAQLAALRGQKEKAIGEINQQKSQVAPQYQQMRNQTDATNLQNVQKLREVMAANGLNSTGENVTANVALNNERVNSLNQLNLQEQQTVDDLNRRISDLNNPAEEQALIAALEAERSRTLYDAYNNSQQMGYQQLRDRIADNRYQQEFDYNKSRDERNFDYQKGLDDRNFEYQKQINAQEKAWREYTYNNMSASEKAQMELNKQQFGEDMAWRMYQMQYQGELQRSQSQAELDFYNNSGFLTP